MSKQTLRIVDQYGTPYTQFSDADIEPWSKLPSAWGEAEFSTSIYDPRTAHVKGLGDAIGVHEVQIWSDQSLDWWGVILRTEDDSDSGLRTAHCVGLEWYLSRMHVLSSNANVLVNPGFEDPTDLDGWTSDGLDSAEATYDESRVRGHRAAKLFKDYDPGGPSGGQLYQDYTEGITGTVGQTAELHASAWCSATFPFAEGAILDRGLYIACTNDAWATLFDEQWVPMPADTPPNTWLRYETKMLAPRWTGYTARIVLHCPAGTSLWDEAFLGAEYFVGPPTVGGVFQWDFVADLNDIVSNLVNHGISRSSYNLTYSGAASGQIVHRLWDTADYGNIFQILQQLNQEGSLDFNVTWNAAGTTRAVQCWFPRRGSLKSNYPLHSGLSVTRFKLSTDGSETTTRAIALNSGDGNDREWAMAEDLLSLPIVLESVDTLPADVPLMGIDNAASQKLIEQKRPARSHTLTCDMSKPPDVRSGLMEGDTTVVTIDKGVSQENGVYRIITKTVNPEADQVSFVVNEE